MKQPKPCPTCGEVNATHQGTEELPVGGPTNRGSIGAEAPRYRYATFDLWHCDTCGDAFETRKRRGR